MTFPTRRALIVGIDHYRRSHLSGAVADANAMASLLARHEDNRVNWFVNLLVSRGNDGQPIDRPRLRTQLLRLFDSSRDIDLLFYFSGHGARTPWGTELVTQDEVPDSLGVSMEDLITLANGSVARSVTIILDCCFSGAAGNLGPTGEPSTSEAFRLERAVLREGVTVLASSGGMERATESRGHGAFTRILLEGLRGDASDHLGYVTTLSLYAHATRSFAGFDQTPTLKTHLFRPTVLREARPWLDPALLRRIPEHFPNVDGRLRLTPEHEGEGRPLPSSDVGTPAQRQFDDLCRLRNVNLVASEDGRDFYWLAMERGEVGLTSLGRYFWRLAVKGVL